MKKQCETDSAFAKFRSFYNAKQTVFSLIIETENIRSFSSYRLGNKKQGKKKNLFRETKSREKICLDPN